MSNVLLGSYGICVPVFYDTVMERLCTGTDDIKLMKKEADIFITKWVILVSITTVAIFVTGCVGYLATVIWTNFFG